jgi:pyruvate dehydrogenase E2 component (dihydrolipoamide acetyltransferase)
VALAALRPTGPQGLIVERDVLAFLAAEPARPRVSPTAQRVAAAAGVDLAAVAEARPGQRIVRADVETLATGVALETVSGPPPDSAAALGIAPAEPGIALPPGGETVPLSPLRRVGAERLQAGHQVIVPVTLTREVDATELVTLRARILEDLEPGAVRPTFTDFFALIAARCLLKHRGLNGVFDGAAITTYGTVNLALAVDTPHGLVAPVLHGAERDGLFELARRRAELVAAAGARRLAPEALAGGTFTLTNLGALRVDAFTPVVNLPEIAILGVGRIRPIPAVNEGQITIRQVVVLSLTFDHRATDGAPAARFLDEVAQFVEKPHRIW